tara:strand:- start:1575 stop:2105 length:531 start_codon:yes stop_codon:yes gene_type:complete
MEKKIITLPTNDSKIYRQILAFMNFMMNITNQEREVLAELVKLNHDYEALPEKIRAKFILSTDMRKEIREFLDIEEKQFNGIISRLKKKDYFGAPILNDDNIIHQGLLFKPDKEGFRIEINLVNTVVPIKKKEKEEEKVEPTEETIVDASKKMATPANGTDNIIENEFDQGDILIS